MPDITIAKALKLKNRLVGRLNKLKADIQLYNSVLKEQAQQVDVPKLFELYASITQNLTTLKTMIAEANILGKVQVDIINLGEKKSMLAWLSCLNTRDGVDRHGYQNTEMHYVAALGKTSVDKICREIESNIDEIQDRLDEFNNTYKISVSQEMLDLAS